jgi:hypothetical protein
VSQIQGWHLTAKWFYLLRANAKTMTDLIEDRAEHLFPIEAGVFRGHIHDPNWAMPRLWVERGRVQSSDFSLLFCENNYDLPLFSSGFVKTALSLRFLVVARESNPDSILRTMENAYREGAGTI